MTGRPAGRRDRKITIEQNTGTVPNALNELTPQWATLARVWAEKQDLTGAERAEADQSAHAVIDTVFRTAVYRADVQANMRIVLDGIYWDIESVAEIGRKDGLEIRARRVQP